jgi:hypothetical protein
VFAAEGLAAEKRLFPEASASERGPVGHGEAISPGRAALAR